MVDPSHILVVGQCPPPVHGSNVMTVRFMDALAHNNFNCEIVEKNFSRKLEQVGRFSIIKILKIPVLYLKIMKAIRRKRPNLCVYFITVGLSSLLVDCLMLSLIRMLGVPYILYLHGRGYRKYNSLIFINKIIYNVFKKSAGCMVLGELLVSEVDQFVDSGRIKILPNGIPAVIEDDFYKQPAEHGCVHIAFLSNLVPDKGPMLFLHMAEKVHTVNPSVKFMIAGRPTSPQYQQQLVDFINQSGLSNCVEIIGPVYGEDKIKFFKKIDIFVLPTSNDALPIVIIEAMQCGVPVISTSVGSIPDVILDNINGFVVEPRDIDALLNRVMLLVNNPKLRMEMGKSGRDIFYEKYSLDAYYANTQKNINFFLSSLC